MKQLNKSYRSVCALSSLLGPSPASSFTAFFNSDNERSVLLILQKLINEKILSKNGALIYPPGVKTDASLLFHLEESKAITADGLNREYIRAVENLTVSKSASLREANLHSFLSSGRLQTVFPALGERLFICVRSFLKNSNIFIQTGKSILINRKAEKEVLSLSRLGLAASVMKNEFSEDFSAFISDLCCFLRAYSTDKTGLERIVKLYLIKNNCKTSISETLSLLLEMNLIISSDSLYHLNRSYLENENTGSVICDSDYSVHLTASPALHSRIHIFCDIKSCDRSTEYTLTKSSFFRGLDEGLSTDEMLSELGNPPYKQLLKSWEEVYSRIRIYSGTVISCSEDTALLITAIPEIRSSIIRKIAENVFLMSTENYSTWSSRLASVLDMENLPKTISEENRSADPPLLTEVIVENKRLPDIENSHETCITRLSDNQESLEEAFKGISGQSTSGMDYRGKLALLKDAVKNADQAVLLMELVDNRLVAARPVELKKSEGTDYLLFRNLFSGEEELIKASGIYSVKLVKLQVLQ